MSTPLDRLLRPDSIAVVGASTDPTKRGHQAVRGLLASSYGGSILPVHPEGGELLGLPVHCTVADLPEVPDLALIAVAAPRVPQAVADCGRIGVAGAVILAVGFRESGPGGAALERAVVEAARAHSIRLIGPNTSGIYNPHIGMNLVGVAPVGPGGLAVLSQSGNVGLDLMTRMTDRGVGLSVYVGVGNEGDLAFHEFLDFFESDPLTRGVLVYADGFRNGTAFLDSAERLNRHKPLAILKGGRSAKGRETALTHTGAVAGSYRIFRELAAQRGLTVVDRSDELLDVGVALSGQPEMKDGSGCAVLADGGGHATLAADLLSAGSVSVPTLSAPTRSALDELLGMAATTGNPIDLAGAADRAPAIFGETADLVVNDPAVGAVLLTGLFGGYSVRFDASLEAEEERSAEHLIDACREASTPLVVHTLFARRSTLALGRLRAAGVPVVDSLECAVRCIEALRSRGIARPEAVVRPVRNPPECDTEVIELARREGRTGLTEWETRKLLEVVEVPLVETRTCGTEEEAAAAAGHDGPLVAKALSGTVLHRTEAGGVRMGLEGPEAVAAAFHAIHTAVDAYARARGIETDFRGILVSRQLPPPICELLVACRRDPQFGPILVLGSGGVAVELSDDVAIRGLPLREGDFEGMIDSLRIGLLLRGDRGQPSIDLQALRKLCEGLDAAMSLYPDIREIELNPVLSYADRVVAVDAVACLADLNP